MMIIMIMILPNEDNTSGNNLLEDDDLCSNVSGSRIAPDRYWLAFFASNKIWRYLRRFSSLLSTPTSLNLIPIVPLLSSHAVIPLPDCVKCCAVFNNASFADLDKWEPKWYEMDEIMMIMMIIIMMIMMMMLTMIMMMIIIV